MTDAASASNQYATALGNCLRRQTRGCTTHTFPRKCNVYVDGSINRSIYYIESGEVKLLLTAASGKQCLLAIYSSGDIFGEQCLAGIEQRQGTAITMIDSVIKQMSCADFLAALRGDELMEGLARYLVGRLERPAAHHCRTVDGGQRAPAAARPCCASPANLASTTRAACASSSASRTRRSPRWWGRHARASANS